MLCTRGLSFSLITLQSVASLLRDCIAHVYGCSFLFFLFSFFLLSEKSALTSSEGKKEENECYAGVPVKIISAVP